MVSTATRRAQIAVIWEHRSLLLLRTVDVPAYLFCNVSNNGDEIKLQQLENTTIY